MSRSTGGFSRSGGRGTTQIPPSYGIRGAVKNRLVKDMFESVTGQFKVLIVDSHATNILNAAMRMHELLEHGVTLVEQIAQTRQPLPQSPAIYFVSPTTTNIEMIKKDWAMKPPYQSANIFFTSTAPNELLDKLAGTQVVNYCSILKDLLIDFQSPESVMYSMNMAYDVTHLYGSIATQRGGQDKLDHAATQLTSVLVTLGEKDPVIRFQDSNMCQRVGRRVSELIGPINQILKGSAMTTNIEHPATVLIVDRSIDMCAPFLHELSYQAMIMDLMPLGDGGLYKHSYEERGGKSVQKTSVIDEEDPVWVEYRHKHMAETLEGVANDLGKLLSDNPEFADEKMGRQGQGMSHLADAVRQLPKFQELKAKYSLHTSINEGLLAQFHNHQLKDICDLEQRIATGEDFEGHKCGFKDLVKEVEKYLNTRVIARDVKLRLIFLIIVVHGTNVTMEKRSEWLAMAGLGASEDHMLGVLKHMNVVGSKEDGKKGGASGAFGGAKNAKRGKEMQNLSRFEPTLKHLVESVANDSLDERQFPTVGGSRGSTRSGGPGAATAGAPRTLRSSAAPKFTSALSRSGTTSSSGSDRILDLGHGKKIPLAAGHGRIVVCVLGGMTYSEVRAMYEVIESSRREIIFGGTNIMTPDQLLQQLPSIE